MATATIYLIITIACALCALCVPVLATQGLNSNSTGVYSKDTGTTTAAVVVLNNSDVFGVCVFPVSVSEALAMREWALV